MQAERLSRLSNVLLDASFRSELSPLFFDYLGWRVDTEEGLRYEFNADLSLFNHLNMKNKRVLEIGCGFGLRLIVFALLGAKKCVGIDISPEMVGDFKKLSDKLDLDVEAICGDFLDYNFGEESFDIALMNESISHIRDTSQLLTKTEKLLCPGGYIWIKDCNNGLFLLLPKKIEVWKKWRRAEYGPIDSKKATIGRQVDRLAYFEARINIIQSIDPSLDENIVRQLAKKTRGMFGDEITQAVEEYKKEKKLSKKPSARYRNPYTGEYEELCFNPLRLAKQIKDLGFRSKLVPPSETCIETNIYAPSRSLVEKSLLKMYMRVVSVSPIIITTLIYPCFTICAKKAN